MATHEQTAETTQSQTIALPASLVERVEQRLHQTDFEGPDEYVTFVVEEVLASVEETHGSQQHDSVDADEVKNRLRSLGYLEDE